MLLDAAEWLIDGEPRFQKSRNRDSGKSRRKFRPFRFADARPPAGGDKVEKTPPSTGHLPRNTAKSEIRQKRFRHTTKVRCNKKICGTTIYVTNVESSGRIADMKKLTACLNHLLLALRRFVEGTIEANGTGHALMVAYAPQFTRRSGANR